jgi:polar amino acid transport system ATP-binding protein
MISFENVDKWYGNYQALNQINETVGKGEVVVICGPSGSGKSTLIRTINRLEPINAGRITVNGIDIHDKSVNVNRLRSEIGFVFQQFNLFPHLSVLRNIMLAPMDVHHVSKIEAKEHAILLLEKVGLANKAEAFPAQLSGGSSSESPLREPLR